MIKKFLTGLGIGLAANTPAQSASYAPYMDQDANFLYNLLFCDDLGLFKNDEAAKSSTLWATLRSDKPDFAALENIARNTEEESRVRVLAYICLRAAGHAVPSKQLLGVIVEVPLQQGLDTLAAYPDGRVRYLNQSGKVSIFEGGPLEVEALARGTCGGVAESCQRNRAMGEKAATAAAVRQCPHHFSCIRWPVLRTGTV